MGNCGFMPLIVSYRTTGIIETAADVAGDRAQSQKTLHWAVIPLSDQHYTPPIHAQPWLSLSALSVSFQS